MVPSQGSVIKKLGGPRQYDPVQGSSDRVHFSGKPINARLRVSRLKHEAMTWTVRSTWRANGHMILDGRT